MGNYISKFVEKICYGFGSRCLVNFYIFGSSGSFCLLVNKDLYEFGFVRGQFFDSYLILFGSRFFVLVRFFLFGVFFIFNIKWFRVVKRFLIFLIVDRRVFCWFVVSVFYFVFLICFQLNLIVFIWVKGRGRGYSESYGFEVVLMILWGVVCNVNRRFFSFCVDVSFSD